MARLQPSARPWGDAPRLGRANIPYKNNGATKIVLPDPHTREFPCGSKKSFFGRYPLKTQENQGIFSKLVITQIGTRHQQNHG
jgi:hypothetical protein